MDGCDMSIKGTDRGGAGGIRFSGLDSISPSLVSKITKRAALTGGGGGEEV